MIGVMLTYDAHDGAMLTYDTHYTDSDGINKGMNGWCSSIRGKQRHIYKDIQWSVPTSWTGLTLAVRWCRLYEFTNNVRSAEVTPSACKNVA